MSDEAVLAAWLNAEGMQIRRRIRILMLLDAADYAIIAPISIARFHAFAYLADILSPLYDFGPLTGKIEKRRIGPYYPELQWEVDRLIGLGLVVPSNLQAIVDIKRAYIEASLTLERVRAGPLLDLVHTQDTFTGLRDFFRQLATALSDIDEKDLDEATQSDVTWEAGSKGALIDYGEWRAKNFSRMSAERIEQIVSEDLGFTENRLSPAAKVNLYVQYLKRAANG
jgi:hypothetical protein